MELTVTVVALLILADQSLLSVKNLQVLELKLMTLFFTKAKML